jgi:hypothetical protein
MSCHPRGDSWVCYFFFFRYAKSGNGQLLLIYLFFNFFFRRGWYAKVETAGFVAGGDLACLVLF